MQNPKEEALFERMDLEEKEISFEEEIPPQLLKKKQIMS